MRIKAAIKFICPMPNVNLVGKESRVKDRKIKK